MSDTLTLTSAVDGFAFSARRVQPQGPRKGGVVVIQEIFGIDSYIQADLERWAARGYEAIAPSLFDRVTPGYVAEHDPEGFQTGVANVGKVGIPAMLSDIQACIDALTGAGPVFAVGYCLGGSLVWQAAAKLTGLAAGSSYYGSQVGANAALPLSCPVIVHLGAKDGHIPADTVKAAVEAAHPDVPVYVYANSGHGFNNDGRPDSDLADAELARERTVALFEANGAGA
ncbi:dienelactone hydrolase family protein [Caulobacter hibisci]|uniref:Dienelactone hydrolase family protein n=1 Tax=Caulobacter hibisci TaxID=2035993 RepID=A0ABS0T1Z9_9CAUL|nr:dienelactone hydrolase family protein [Caulobacter hibisci]MBI1685907.1 dienelactone hydrolase family protein [Caulobacter hibisci]